MEYRNEEISSEGKSGFIVGLCEALGLPRIINEKLEKEEGRKPEIPYGILAEMMLVNMCDVHYPLYALNEYYEFKDLEGIFHCPINIDQINDDRFGGFLDLLFEAEPRKIFGQIAINSLKKYGIQVKKINFDTTSKVMWGEYKNGENEEVGAIQIEFGHSKAHRQDKKQIKMGIGCADGIVVDAKVLSGGMDDKTYNNENMDTMKEVLENLEISKEDFYYTADSAAFSEDCLKKAKKADLKLITRMPDSVNEAKELIGEGLANFNTLEKYTHVNAKGIELDYRYYGSKGEYRGIELSYGVYYSENLKETKQRAIEKQVKKEEEKIKKLTKECGKRDFSCEEDAKKEIEKLFKKDLKKIKFFEVKFDIEKIPIKRRGKPSKDGSHILGYEYKLKATHEAISKEIENAVIKGCMFVLCSNDPDIDALELLKEYKTQSSVEKKFQQLKSPQFVNSIYLDSPKRVEAFAYLMLISILILSIAEYVVRRGLKEDGISIIGRDNRKTNKPSLQAIYGFFYSVRVRLIKHAHHSERHFVEPLRENVRAVLRYLGISETTFIKGLN